MSDNTTTRPDDTSCAYTYTVKRGDSFYLIARRLGVPLRGLMNANPDIHPARLMVGDELCIPSCAERGLLRLALRAGARAAARQFSCARRARRRQPARAAARQIPCARYARRRQPARAAARQFSCARRARH